MTGLPVALPLPPFMDPEWKEPAKTLNDVVFEGLPVSEVARGIREEFTNAFDIVIPTTWRDPQNPHRAVNPDEVLVSLRLRNVTASEVFSAMNLLFDTENAPVRWELRMNGKRPVAVLRVVEWLVPHSSPDQAPRSTLARKVFSVGSLISNEKTGRRNMEELVQTITDVYKSSFGSADGVLKFHKGAELLVVYGYPEQIDFVEQVISSLSR